MGLTKFCCCCDLRRGCIAFAWLQLMLIAMGIAGMSIPLSLLGYNMNPHQDEVIAGIYAGLNLFIAQQIIKGFTCIALIWGLVKKQDIFYQAWMFVSGIENCVLSLSSLGCFFGGFGLPYLFIPMIVLSVLAGLAWYFWFSVYAVYQIDMKTTNIIFSENYENMNLVVNNTAET